MSTRFPDDYDERQLTQVGTCGFGFDLWVTPRFVHHYTAAPYEELTALLVRQMALRAACFIDVGAHYGFYSVLVGRSNPGCSIIAFEPVTENVEILRKNLELHEIEGDVNAVAVSDRTGRIPFQVSCASDNSGFVANPKGGVLRTVDTEVAPLDDYRERIPEGPLIVKIDTEGHEPHVLNGMRDLLREHHDIRLVIEFNPGCLKANGFEPQDLLATINGLGLEIFVVHDDAMTFEKFNHGSQWQQLVGSKSYVNIVCVPRKLSMHLCIFAHSSGLEGAERSLLELVDFLVSERGTLCTVVLPPGGPLIRMLNQKGAATLTADIEWWCSESALEAGEIQRRMAVGCSRTLGLVSVLERARPDVIVTNTMVAPWGGLVAVILDLPHIWWVKEFGELDHDLKFFLDFGKIVRMIETSSNHILATSCAVKDTLFGGLEDDRCTVGYNDKIVVPGGPESDRSCFHFPQSTKMLFAGRATAAKGLDDAIRATRKLVDSGQDVELCVVGPIETPFGREMQRLATDLKVSDRIHFLGFVDNVRGVLEQADVGLMCSKCEAFGRVTAETMLVGKPVVGTNTGGTVELIDDGVTGFLYSPGDADELADKILLLIESPESEGDFGNRARSSIVKKLQERPASELMHTLCDRYKGTPAPDARELLVTLLDWQSGWMEDLNNQVCRLTEEIESREERSKAQSARLADARSELQRVQTRSKELEALISEREKEIERLAAHSTTLEGHIKRLNAEVAERDKEVEALAARSLVLEEQTESLRVELRGRDEHIDGIVNSRAWRIADALWRVRVSIAPPGTLRARLLERFRA